MHGVRSTENKRAGTTPHSKRPKEEFAHHVLDDMFEYTYTWFSVDAQREFARISSLTVRRQDTA